MTNFLTAVFLNLLLTIVTLIGSIQATNLCQQMNISTLTNSNNLLHLTLGQHRAIYIKY